MRWMTEVTHTLDEPALVAAAGRLAHALEPGTVLFLQGDLGAGKTTWVRAMLRALGWQQAVKSPTYALVESYPLAVFPFHHFDCYRLRDAEELQMMGIRDYFDGRAVVAVEWPDKGAGELPAPDLIIALAGDGSTRQMRWSAVTERGQRLCAAFDADEKAR
jgi:tRNA threonylcarbamoyladenosine biosynthesis protein TsaE